MHIAVAFRGPAPDPGVFRPQRNTQTRRKPIGGLYEPARRYPEPSGTGRRGIGAGASGCLDEDRGGRFADPALAIDRKHLGALDLHRGILMHLHRSLAVLSPKVRDIVARAHIVLQSACAVFAWFFLVEIPRGPGQGPGMPRQYARIAFILPPPLPSGPRSRRPLRAARQAWPGRGSNKRAHAPRSDGSPSARRRRG